MVSKSLNDAMENAMRQIKGMHDANCKCCNDDVKMTVGAQLDVLRKFNAPHGFQVGDVVERNAFGMARYAHPKTDQGRIAMVTAVFDNPLIDEDGKVVNGEIAITAAGAEIAKAFTCDLRFYKKMGV